MTHRRRTFLIFILCAIIVITLSDAATSDDNTRRQLRYGDSMEGDSESRRSCNYCRESWSLTYRKSECWLPHSDGCTMHYVEAFGSCGHVCTFANHVHVRVTNYYNSQASELTNALASLHYTNSQSELNRYKTMTEEFLELATLLNTAEGITWCHTLLASIAARKREIKLQEVRRLATELSNSCGDYALGIISDNSRLDRIRDEASKLITKAQEASDFQSVQLAKDCKNRISNRRVQIKKENCQKVARGLSPLCSEHALSLITDLSELTKIEKKASELESIANDASEFSSLQLSRDCVTRVENRRRQIKWDECSRLSKKLMQSCSENSLSQVSSVKVLDDLKGEASELRRLAREFSDHFSVQVSDECENRLKHSKLILLKSAAHFAVNSLNPVDTDEGIAAKVACIAEFQTYAAKFGFASDASIGSEWLEEASAVQRSVNYHNSYDRASVSFQKIKNIRNPGLESSEVIAEAHKHISAFIRISSRDTERESDYELACTWKAVVDELVHDLELLNMKNTFVHDIEQMVKNPTTKLTFNELLRIHNSINEFVKHAEKVGSSSQKALAKNVENDAVHSAKIVTASDFERQLALFDAKISELNSVWDISHTKELVHQNENGTPVAACQELKNTLEDAEDLVLDSKKILKSVNQYCKTLRMWLSPNDSAKCDSVIATSIKDVQQKKEFLDEATEKLLIGRGWVFLKKLGFFLTLRWHRLF